MSVTGKDVLAGIARTGVVPLFTHDDASEIFSILETSDDAGIRVFEMTNRRPNSFEVFSTLAKRMHQLPDMLLGIGTIMDGNTTRSFIDAGASFIISPIMNPEMAKVCREQQVMWIPGCATPTEIITARDLGAELIKVFPGAVLGPAFVAAVKAIAPEVKLMITGGVEPTEENLSSWFKAGAECVGMGSNLFPADLVQRKDWPAIGQRIRTTVAMVARVRS